VEGCPIEILKLESVTRKFDEFVALDSVDLAVNQGEILGMIGPNGSGKTTLFNVISGITTPTSGCVYYKGQPLGRKKPHAICRMGIARTFQIVQPFSHMTVADNVLVAAMYGNGLSQTEGRNKVKEVLHFVGLDNRAGVTPNEMTTSDRRRLELARALATGPELILLDEMMAGLTPLEVDDALGLLREIQASGITIFMVEHIMRAVMSVCNRVTVLNHGQKIAEGSPREVTGNSEVIKAYLGDRCA
jgi:branched-chain amino acid transport system ATP-binding protein